MNIFLRILAVLFFLIGLLAGGCSLVFAPTVFGYGDLGVAPIWLAGVAAAVAFIWAAVAIWKKS
ncbi:MAG: hypothetical protein U1E58_03030 [Tabrizicola sp.]